MCTYMLHTCTGFCGCARICYNHGHTSCFVLTQAVSNLGCTFYQRAIYTRLLSCYPDHNRFPVLVILLELLHKSSCAPCHNYCAQSQLHVRVCTVHYRTTASLQAIMAHHMHLAMPAWARLACSQLTMAEQK